MEGRGGNGHRRGGVLNTSPDMESPSTNDQFQDQNPYTFVDRDLCLEKNRLQTKILDFFQTLTGGYEDTYTC